MMASNKDSNPTRKGAPKEAAPLEGLSDTGDEPEGTDVGAEPEGTGIGVWAKGTGGNTGEGETGD